MMSSSSVYLTPDNGHCPGSTDKNEAGEQTKNSEVTRLLSLLSRKRWYPEHIRELARTGKWRESDKGTTCWFIEGKWLVYVGN